MSRHARGPDGSGRAVRLTVLIVVWLAGLGAGWSALLAAAARYGCGPGSRAFGCTTPGSVLGIGLVLVAIAVVTTVTLLIAECEPPRATSLGVVGLTILLVCFLVAQGILDTV